MEVLTLPADIEGLSPESNGHVVAIGNFDGVHLGHLAVIAKVKELAVSCPFGVYTLYPHPREVFNPKAGHRYLTPLPEKLELLASLGIPKVWLQTFGMEFAQVSAEAFVERVLVGALKAKWLVVGKDFCFGRGRRGNTHMLERMGALYGFRVYTPEMVCRFGRPISSSWIKELLSKGEAEKAAKILSRPYTVYGVVERGEGRGRLLGCPTANLVLDPKKYTPMLGVYAGFARVEGKTYRAVANIGQKPTFDDERLSLEVHLIGFEGDLYGRQLSFEFLKFLRGQKLFPSPLALAEQIQRDIKEASAVLGADSGVSL